MVTLDRIRLTGLLTKTLARPRGSSILRRGSRGPKTGYPNEPTINTATFSEVDGRTTLTLLVEAPRKEIRDAVVPSGMEDGLQDALDLLEEVAVSLDR